MDISTTHHKNTKDAFAVVEKMLWETFFPCLFFKNSKTLSPIVVTLSMTPFNKSGMGILITMTPEREKVPKFATCNHRVDFGRDGVRHIFQHQYYAGAQGRFL